MMDDADAQKFSEDEDDILTMLRKRREQQVRDNDAVNSAQKDAGRACPEKKAHSARKQKKPAN